MAEYLIQDTTLTAIADAIRTKTGGTDPIAPEDMPEAIDRIVSSEIGTGSEIGDGDYSVIVIDYNGRVLMQRYLNEGDSLTLPDAPIHDRLTFEGWVSHVEITNNTVTVGNQDIIIGAMYHTASGATEIDIVLTKKTGLSFTFLDVLTGMTSIDWGDGSSDNSLTHTYAEYGEYTVKIYGMTQIAAGTSSGGIVARYGYTIKRVFFSNMIESIGNYAFTICYSLEEIAIPNSVTSIGTYALNGNRSLKALVLPNNIQSIPGSLVYDCTTLYAVVIPSGVTNLGSSAFEDCYSLRYAPLPSGISGSLSYTFRTNYSLRKIFVPSGIKSIGYYVFNACNSVEIYDFSLHTTVPSLTTTNAFGGISAIAKILVPAALYDSWIAATNWSTYADYIVAV